MTTMRYPAIIERGIASGYSVFFPDLPGCASAGDTIQEAATKAEEALHGHLSLMVKDDDAIPEPTALDNIPADPDVDEAARILVRTELPGKLVQFNISLDESLLFRVDSFAKRFGMDRSSFLAEAARQILDCR